MISTTPNLSTVRSRAGALRVIVVAFLVITACITRLEAPSRMDVTTDEMIHTTRYLMDYENHKFLEILDRAIAKHDRNFTPAQEQKIAEVYGSSHVLQRLQFVFLRDAHPPVFAVIAELINCTGGHKLLVGRIVAMFAGLAFIWLLYLAGKEYAGPELGLWLAGLATVSLAFTVYAGISRPYVYAQLAAAFVFLVFLRRKPSSPSLLYGFLGAALLAQATDWMLWPAIAPMLLLVLYERWLVTRSVRAILRESWWYLLSGCMLLVLFRVQVANPHISGQLAGKRDLLRNWNELALATPFAGLGGILHNDRLLESWTTIAAIVFFVSCAVGVAAILVRREQGRYERIALAFAVVAGAIELFLVPPQVRFYIVPVTILLFGAGVGINYLASRRQYSEYAFAAVMVFFAAVSLFRPENPYRRIFDYETRYSQVAARLSSAMKPGDVWFSEPYFLANNLYLYGPPPPLTPSNDEYGADVLHRCATTMNCYVFVSGPGDMTKIAGDAGTGNVPLPEMFEFQNHAILFRYPHEKTVSPR